MDKFARLFSQEVQEVQDDGISQIITGDDSVAITYHGETLYLAYEQSEDGSVLLYLGDASGNQVASELDEATVTYKIMDERFDIALRRWLGVETGKFGTIEIGLFLQFDVYN